MYNSYLAIPFACWLVAQTIKFSLRAFKGDITPRLLYASGGMPSAHTAVVISLAMVALLDQGANSPVFGTTSILALIVMYDALGVRRMAGEQAAAFNRLLRALEGSRLGLPGEPSIRELKGHTPAEVLAGAALGFVMAVLFNTSKLETQFGWLSSAPTQVEAMILAAVFGSMIVGGFIYGAVMKRRYKGSSAVMKVSSAVMVMTQSIGWPGVLLTFAGLQKASFLAWRAWPVLLLLAYVVWHGTLTKKYKGSLQSVLAAESQQKRKERWLKAHHRKN